MNKITVIHHSADFDGIFCREIAQKFLPDAELIGWDWADAKIPFPREGTVYVLDLSPDCFEAITFEDALRLIWIDHHKSAIDKYAKHEPPLTGYRVDGVAACRLAWQWFNLPRIGGAVTAITKEDFIDRKVTEPLAVRLAGEYDIWDKRDPSADVFQFGLRSQDLDGWWPAMLSDEATATVAEIENRLEQGSKYDLLPNGNIKVPGLGDRVVKMLLKNGALLMRYQRETDASVVNYRSFMVEFEGLKFLTLTIARCNSLTFDAKDLPETGHDALMAFYFNGENWNVSLYHAKHRKDLDLSTIAVKYGGGGHRGACGFRVGKLPFLK